MEEGDIRPYADLDGGFNGTLTDSDGFAYEFEGKSGIASYTADLESRHDANEVTREPEFKPETEAKKLQYEYKDAVYGYVDKETAFTGLRPTWRV